jgi:thiol-disulfide isomerase/thioredoxin
MYAQDYNFQLQLEGIQYDSLTIAGLNQEEQVVKIKGVSNNKQDWNFTIPDSIFNSVAFFQIFHRNTDRINHISYNTLVQTCHGQDTLNYYSLSLDKNIKIIQAKYIGQKVKENELIVKIGSTKEEDMFFGQLITDKLLIPYYENTELAIQATHPYFGIFYSTLDNEPSYEEYINLYIKKIKEYPDSRYLITQINRGLQSYNTKDDLQKIYDAFSESNKQTNFGKKIHNYLENHFVFSDTILPTYDTGQLEPIIQDSTKINLVVFSASWCIPCHKQIPILKEIYNDLKKCIEITYISEDEPKYVDNWRKLMREENIPWRSLLAMNDVEVIQKKYNAIAIPYTLLVYSGSDRLETIDIRIKEDKDKLYSLCGK